jgi:prepilin-type N-terminal cleavage/methylation domain-containing protein
MRRQPPIPSRGAFTLIELVVSMALMALILTAAYACLSAGIGGKRLVEPRADVFQSARVALDLLSADIRCACPLAKGAPFLGVHRVLGDVTADNLDFATHHFSPKRSGEGDYCEESLFVEKDPKTGRYTLWRRRNPTLSFDPLAGGIREEIASGIAGLRLEYYDGLDWYDSWGDPNFGSAKSEAVTVPKPNMTGLPEAVRITLSFDSNPRAPRSSPTGQGSDSPQAEPPLVFQTIARLNLAGREASGSVGASPSSGGSPGESASGAAPKGTR